MTEKTEEPVGDRALKIAEERLERTAKRNETDKESIMDVLKQTKIAVWLLTAGDRDSLYIPTPLIESEIKKAMNLLLTEERKKNKLITNNNETVWNQIDRIATYLFSVGQINLSADMVRIRKELLETLEREQAERKKHEEEKTFKEYKVCACDKNHVR